MCYVKERVIKEQTKIETQYTLTKNIPTEQLSVAYFPLIYISTIFHSSTHFVLPRYSS